jgi:hypothetical protein
LTVSGQLTAGGLSYPTSDGTNEQVLRTDGSGNLSFGTISGTTINNNTNNYVMTGTGTANTLNGESGLTYDGSTFAVSGATTTTGLTVNTNALTLQSLDTSVNDTESIGDIEFKSNDSSSGGTGVQAKISALAEGAFGITYGLAFLTGTGASPTEKLRIDNSGRIGITVVPETDWHVDRPPLQIGNNGSISSKSTSTNAQMSVNANAKQIATSNATGWKYIDSEYASQHFQFNGEHQFRVAPSGTADAAITWTNAMVIDNSGNVGIGETSPSAKFHVKKTAASTQHYDQYATAIVEDTEARLQIVASEGGSNAAGLLLTNEAKHWGVVHHGTGNSNIFSIGYYASGSSGLDLSDNLSDILNITTGGNVGIGATPETAPYYNNDDPVLTVHKASGSAILPIVAAANTSSAILHLNQSANRYWRMSAIYGGQLTFGGKQPGSGAAESEAMRIDQNNKLLIGHTSAVGGHSEKLGIDTGAANSYGIFISGPSSTDGTQTAIRFWDSGSSPGLVGSIKFTTNSTIYNTSSDYRLKENVVTDWDATTRLKQLKPSRFNFINEPDMTVDGFLAHEVQDIVPEAISGVKDEMQEEEYEVTPAVLDDDGNIVTEAVMGTRSVPEYQGIDQSKLVPLLVKTIQELEERITTLENA